MPTVAELMEALPEPIGELHDQPPGPVPELLEDWALRPVPVGAFRRLRVLGTLQAEIGAAYLFHWLRGWFKDAMTSAAGRDALADGIRVLDSMASCAVQR
jgi:hypothetical protein